MWSAVSIWVLFLATAAFGRESMNVAVCNLSQLSDATIERAEAEAAYVFQVMDVDIHWTGCGAEVGAVDARLRPDFIIRVQLGGRIAKGGPVSLEAMGRAFMDSTEYGFMVDAYAGAIEDLTLRFPISGSDQLLGYVMTHELGHLLIGAGHRPDGIMRSSWGKAEMENLNRRHLKFNPWERASILHNLRARKADSAAPR